MLLASLPAALEIGFLSDDFVLIDSASGTPLWSPLESGHLAPVMTALFKLVQAGKLGPGGWHCMALILHVANCWYLALLLERGLGVGRLIATGAGLAFGVTVAGSEAILWASGLGYVALLSFVLMALFVLLVFESRGCSKVADVALLLAAIQLAALLVWDWAAILTPLVVMALAVGRLGAPGRPAKPAIAFVLPAGLVWIGWLVGRTVLGVDTGYGLLPNGLLRSVVMAFAGPGYVLAPMLGRIPILAVAALFALLVAAEAQRSRQQRILLVALLAVIAPVLAFSGPQGRYYYLSAPFVFSIASVGVARRFGMIAWGVLVSLLLVSQGPQFRAQARDWRAASRASERLSEDLRSGISSFGEVEQVVVVNLPDRYGDPDNRWRPYSWRNGIHRIWPDLQRVYTDDYVATYEPHNTGSVPRSQVRREFPRASILEVVPHDGEAGWRYAVEVFNEPGVTESN